jgi:hypothetical protein
MAGVEMHSLRLRTNKGVWQLNVKVLRSTWPRAFDDEHAVILIFDVTSVFSWHGDLTRVCEGIHVVWCGNKVEIKDPKAKAKWIEESITTFQPIVASTSISLFFGCYCESFSEFVSLHVGGPSSL